MSFINEPVSFFLQIGLHISVNCSTIIQAIKSSKRPPVYSKWKKRTTVLTTTSIFIRGLGL